MIPKYLDTGCTYKEEYLPEHTFIFKGNCVITNTRQQVIVPAKELFEYRQGKTIQEAMPSLNADEREFLLSGISPEGWNKKFGTE